MTPSTRDRCLKILLILAGIFAFILNPAAMIALHPKWVLRTQAAVMVSAGVFGWFGLLASVYRTPLTRGRVGRTIPLLLLGAGLLVVLWIAWNIEFRFYMKTHLLNREVFRKAFVNFYSPMYGRRDHVRPYWRNRIILLAFAWTAFVFIRPLRARWGLGSWTILLGLQLALILTFGLSESRERAFSSDFQGYHQFRLDIPAFGGVADTLRHYRQRMSDLHWYGQHYPPGNLILVEIEEALHAPGLSKWIVILLTIVSAFPLYGLAREVGLEPTAVSCALMLYVASAGMLIHSTFNTTSLIAFPAALCLWALVRCLNRADEWWSGALLGFACVFYLMFSFSISVLSITMGLIVLIGWWTGTWRGRDGLRTFGIAGVTFIGLWLLLWGSSGCNLIACLLQGVKDHNRQQMGGAYDNPVRYLIRSSGNIIAYLVFIFPLGVLAVAGVASAWRERARPVLRAVAPAAGLTILIAGFSGQFFLETERIWIFMTPALAVAAGAELARRTHVEGERIARGVLVIAIAFSCFQEIVWMHYRP
jgi:hypothetical protein